MAQKPGAISRAVAESMGRRMGVGMTVDSPAPDPMLYLDRFGDYDRQKHLGLFAWLTGGILRTLWSGRPEAASDRAALLLVALDHANMDQGSFDLAWLLTLEEEPPRQVFARAPPPTTAMGRSFTPLASQKWSTIAMAYLKELDVLQTRRAEATRSRPAGEGATTTSSGSAGAAGGAAPAAQEGGSQRRRPKAKAKPEA